MSVKIDPEGPRRTQKEQEGPSKAQKAKTDWSSSFRSLKLFKLVENHKFLLPFTLCTSIDTVIIRDYMNPHLTLV